MIVTNAFNQNLSDESKEHWLSYWRHFTKTEYCFCSEANCTKNHAHGVLVKKKNQDERALFVVPLCHEHSHAFTSQLELDDKADLIPADLSL